MDRQGFDPFNSTPMQLVEFMERIEAMEDPVMTEVKGKDKSSKTKLTKEHDKTKTCSLHGPGHSTEECRALKAKKARKCDDGNRGGDKSSGKDWRKKSGVSTPLSKKELQLLIQKQTRAELKTFAEKKGGKHKSDAKDSDDDDVSLNAFNMEAFSYKDLEGLSLEDKKMPAKKAAPKKDDPDSMDEFKLSDDNTVMTKDSA
jgi:hypothetical protein